MSTWAARSGREVSEPASRTIRRCRCDLTGTLITCDPIPVSTGFGILTTGFVASIDGLALSARCGEPLFPLQDSARRIAGARRTSSSSRGGHPSRSFGRKRKGVYGRERHRPSLSFTTLRGGEAGRSKVKGQKANVKSDGILPFDLCDLHFDLPFDGN